MTSEQIERVEKMVNEAIAADMPVHKQTKSLDEAKKEGAMALFGEKYGETVRTISILESDSSTVGQKYSYELCGGTHLERTSDIGAFLIVSESSVAANVRRIEAVTGRGAYELIAERFKTFKQTAAALKTSLDEVPLKVEMLQDEVSDLKKELANLRAQSADLAFVVLPLDAKLRIGLNAFAKMFVQLTDQETQVGEKDDEFIWTILKGPCCWGRRNEEKPVCYIAAGLLLESLKWVSGGSEFRVTESKCIAIGHDVCEFVIPKQPVA